MKNERIIIQFCGLSGSGKTTLAQNAKAYFETAGVNIEVIDGDEYRKALCADLGFSKQDRNTNIRRLAFVASRLAQYNVIPIICAINPYEEIRKEVAFSYANVKTVYIKCGLGELMRRDPKGLYARALLPNSDANKLLNLTGVNDAFEVPTTADLIIETDQESIADSTQKLISFVQAHLYIP